MITALKDLPLGLQSGVVARTQLVSDGIQPHDIRRRVRRRELVRVHDGVFVPHNGPLSWDERAWAALLRCWPAALFGESALFATDPAGGWARPETATQRAMASPSAIQPSAIQPSAIQPSAIQPSAIHLAVDRHRNLHAPAGIVLHRLIRFEQRIQWNLTPPRQRFEDALLELVSSAPRELDAIALIARASASRRTTAARVREALDQRPLIARRSWLAGVLDDVAQGTGSVLEHGYLVRVERPHALPRAERQAVGHSSVGLVYRDAEYAEGLIVELDSRLHHDSTEQRDADFERDLDADVQGRATRRLSWGQVFDRPCSTASKLALLLQRLGWTGIPASCPRPDCAILRSS